MDNKLIQSQINLITAQLDQLSESGIFSADEIERLSVSYKEKLYNLQSLLEDMSISANDIEVVSPVNISK